MKLKKNAGELEFYNHFFELKLGSKSWTWVFGFSAGFVVLFVCNFLFTLLYGKLSF